MERSREAPGIWVMVIVLCITLAVVSMMNSALKKSQSQEVSYDEFVRMIEGGEVEAVRESGSRLVIRCQRAAPPSIPG